MITAAPGAAVKGAARRRVEEDGGVEDDRHDNSGPGSGVEPELVTEPEPAVPANTDAVRQEAGNDNSRPGRRQ